MAAAVVDEIWRRKFIFISDRGSPITEVDYAGDPKSKKPIVSARGFDSNAATGGATIYGLIRLPDAVRGPRSGRYVGEAGDSLACRGR
jgi:hypothetical protein